MQAWGGITHALSWPAPPTITLSPDPPAFPAAGRGLIASAGTGPIIDEPSTQGVQQRRDSRLPRSRRPFKVMLAGPRLDRPRLQAQRPLGLALHPHAQRRLELSPPVLPLSRVIHIVGMTLGSAP